MQTFNPGDEQPKDVKAVIDRFGRVWHHHSEYNTWHWMDNSLSWRGLLNGGIVTEAKYAE